MKSKNNYIVSIKHTETGKERRYVLSRAKLLGLKIAILLFILFDITAMVSGVLMYKQLRKYRDLEAENAKLKKQVEHAILLGKEVLRFRKVRERVLNLLGVETEGTALILDATDTLIVPSDVSFSLKGLPTKGVISRGFSRYHPAVDIAAPIGTPVFAPAEGIVTQVGENQRYGKYLEINHTGGYSTFYGHLDQVLVIEGWQVNQGDLIAKVGNTGISTGPHLHFEVRKNGIPVNPLKLIQGDSELLSHD